MEVNLVTIIMKNTPEKATFYKRKESYIMEGIEMFH